MGTTLLHLRKEKLDNQHSRGVCGNVAAGSSPYSDQRRVIKTILLSVKKEERRGTILPSAADQALIDQAYLQEINDELAQQNRSLCLPYQSRTAEIDQGFIVDFEDFDVDYSIEKVLTSVLWEDAEGDVQGDYLS